MGVAAIEAGRNTALESAGNRSAASASLDVQPLVDHLWKEAQQAGYTVAKYNDGLVPFGSYDAVRGESEGSIVGIWRRK